ncbi:uncharacterized protein METZ01_LOCUS457918 [marine metagenome]|uniref:Uncharacterized protein n=1 Tax=marine metagenome TaxID=408172 RepID=A0A383ABM3_9ZZZZ
MPKRLPTIRVKLPGYQRNRSLWREKILAAVRKTTKETCADDHKLEVVVLLYMTKGKRLTIHDVDNRLKDILDALQGRFGSRRASKDKPLIKNDNCVYRAVIEKQAIPKVLPDKAGGYLLIRPYRRSRWPLQRTKGAGLRK